MDQNQVGFQIQESGQLQYAGGRAVFWLYIHEELPL